MKIGFIGAGRVGCALGQDLKQKQMDVVGYYSLHFEHADMASKAVGGTLFESPEALVKACDCLFLTVVDDAISDVVDTLKACALRLDEKIVVHTSGVHASSILEPLAVQGASIYAIHPLQAFASVEQALKQLSHTIFSVEGTGFRPKQATNLASVAAYAVTKQAKQIIGLMQDANYEYFIMRAEDKAIYHSAAVIASNYLVATLDFALSQFERIGCDQAFAMKALFPLIQGTIDNIERFGTVSALTGPIARGDVNTVEKHLATLEGEDELLYRTLGLKTLSIAEKKGLSSMLAAQLLNRLKEE